MTEISGDSHHTITHIWERVHVKWLIAGGIAGFLAGLLTIVVSSFLSLTKLGDVTQPFKLIGAVLFGYEATAYGPLGAAGLAGIAIHFTLSVLYGIIFAQLVCEKSKPRSLVILGLVTSLIIWVFSAMLFLPSFNVTLALFLNKGLGLFLHILFGVSFGFFLHLSRKKLISNQEPDYTSSQ